MPVEHDGISTPLPLNVVVLVIALALFGVGGAAISMGHIVGSLVFVPALLVFLDLFGNRRIRVIHSKLLVEDYRWITNLLIGPRRRRIEWTEVKGVKVEGGRLVLTTAGAPFVTGERASAADLAALEAMIKASMAKAVKNAGR